MRIVILAAIAAGFVLSALPTVDAAPPKGKPLGGVNLTYYCQVHYGANYKAAVLGAGTAYDWRCVPKVPSAGMIDHPISVTDACLLQYGQPSLRAYPLNPNDPTSWRCFPGKGNGPRR